MIRIRTTLTSDTPHLPELAPLVGRRVSITVEEEPAAPPLPPGVAAPDLPTSEQLAQRHAAAERLSRSTYNRNVLAEQDAIDLADQEAWDR